MAESVEDIQRLTTLTDKFMRERKLEINEAKSACMRVGRGRAEGLSVKVGVVGQEATIGEVNVYKYSGS